MKKILLVVCMIMLTGCFEKKTNLNNNSDFLEITNFLSNNIDENGNVVSSNSGNSGSSIIINSSTVITVNKLVIISFSEIINAQTVTGSSVYISGPNGEIIPVQLSVEGNQIRIIPDAFFLFDERYTIVITTAVKDIQGRSLEGVLIYTFSTETEVIIAPTLSSLSPSDGATTAATTTNVTMTFSEDITGDGVIELKNSSTNTVITGSKSIVGDTLRFVPDNALINGTKYIASLDGTVEDFDGNAYDGSTTWDFSIVSLTPTPDTTPPTVGTFTPADGATNVPVNTTIQMLFDEDITNAGKIFQVKITGGAAIGGTEGASGNTLSFSPNVPLLINTNYTVTILGDTIDSSGNVYTGQTSWSFTTVP